MKEENSNYVNYLIQLSQQGRKGAYIDLWEIYINSIYTTIKRLLYKDELVKEVLTRAFLEGWNKVRDYDTRQPFGGWLKNIALYLSIFELRNQESNKEETKLKIRSIDDSKYLEELIQTIPADERIAFILHDIEGYSYEAIKKYFSDLIIDEIKTLVINTRQLIMAKIGI